MKLTKTLLATSALTVAAVGAYAAGHGMADSMTLVSWGGAYQNSQIKAYSDPYIANNAGVSVVWDESSAEAVAKLRAMNEAGNITWDLVDVEAADAIRLCDEGLAMEIDHDEMLAAGNDGSSASDDFGDSIISDCFIPQIVFSTTASGALFSTAAAGAPLGSVVPLAPSQARRETLKRTPAIEASEQVRVARRRENIGRKLARFDRAGKSRAKPVSSAVCAEPRAPKRSRELGKDRVISSL